MVFFESCASARFISEPNVSVSSSFTQTAGKLQQEIISIEGLYKAFCKNAGSDDYVWANFYTAAM